MPAKDLVFLDQLAEALLAELPEREDQDRALNELATIADALQSDQSFRDTLLNQALPVQARKKFLRTALEGRLHTATLNAMLMLLREQRLDELPLFLTRLRSVRLRLAAVRDVLVTSAVPLTEGERNRLRETLESRWQTAIQLREQVDSKLIGGLTLTADDWYYDATIAGRLKRLGQSLTHHASRITHYQK